MTAMSVNTPLREGSKSMIFSDENKLYQCLFTVCLWDSQYITFQASTADERIGTMPGTAAPRAWRQNPPEGLMKDGCWLDDVCNYNRVVSKKGDVVVTDRFSERGEPRYEYFEIKKTQDLWNCRDGSRGWRNYKRLKSDQGNWGPWHWGAWRTASTKMSTDDPYLKRICQGS